MADTDKLVKVGQLDTVADAVIEVISDTNERLDQIGGGGLTADVKAALLACFNHVAWDSADPTGQSYISALQAALYPPANLSSISAVYTQSGAVLEGASLDTLKSDLVVTAHYSDSTTETITAYTLSGTLSEGTSTITVTYGGKTTTFNVTVTGVVSGWLYNFDNNIVSSGSKDFGFEGTPSYGTGHDGTGQAYQLVVETEGTTKTTGIYKTGLSDIPDLSADFTISLWGKSITNLRGMFFSAQKYISEGSASDFGTLTTVKQGWSCSKSATTLKYKGVAFRYISSKLKVFIFSAEDDTYGKGIECTPPSSFDSTQWHHYALTRKGTTIYLFIDGEIIFTLSDVSFPVYIANQVSVGSAFNETSSGGINSYAYGSLVDDLYIAESCKWDAAFDPTAITY